MLSKNLLTLLLVSISIAFVSCSHKNASKCEKNIEALYDIGSGSTKTLVVEIDSCSTKRRILYRNTVKVDYKEDLIKNSKTKEFSEKVQSDGLAALKYFKELSLPYKPVRQRGIATAAFREAKNAGAFVERIKKELAIEITVISQEREAQLAFEAVANSLDDKSLVVWDIGGGSFQFITKNEEKWSIFEGELASVSFKELVNKRIKRKGIQSSPNPLTVSQVNLARELVAKELKGKFSPEFIESIRGKKIVGIGGVHSSSIRAHSGKDSYTAHDLDLWISQNHGKKDSELNDAYASTVITNMILVSEIMKLLSIETVEAKGISLMEAL